MPLTGERLLACHKTQYWLLNRIKLIYKADGGPYLERRARWKYAEPFRQVYMKKENARKKRALALCPHHVPIGSGTTYSFSTRSNPKEELEAGQERKSVSHIMPRIVMLDHGGFKLLTRRCIGSGYCWRSDLALSNKRLAQFIAKKSRQRPEERLKNSCGA